MNTTLNDVMRRFAHFLSASWNAASAAATQMAQVEAAEFMSDWAQANWEILVETPFRELVGFGEAYLEPYADGADCNDGSSRVWNPGALATHRLVFRAVDDVPMFDLLTGRSVDATETPALFDHFASKSERGWHDQVPPFDCVLGHQNGQEVLVRLDEVAFAVEPFSCGALGQR